MFGKKKKQNASLLEILNTPLFSWPGHPSDKWTIGDATEGCQIFGATGSGKSSGSGKQIAMSFLKNGFGGLVLCAKPDEKEHWEQYARDAGREDDLVIFEPGKGEFNPLYFEQNRMGDGRGETLNMVNMIMVLYDLGKSFMSGGAGGGENEKFWDQSLRRLTSRCLDLLKFSQVHGLSIINMRNLLGSSFSREEADRYKELRSILLDKNAGENDKDIVIQELEQWSKTSFFLECLNAIENLEGLSPDQEDTKVMVKDYFLREFAYLSERTKSIIVESFLGLVEPFLTGMLKRQFTGTISEELWPELTYEEGKIIILDFPVKQHLVAGVYAQGIYKYCWMQEMERRKINEENLRPVFLWIDEAQFFLNAEYDSLFQTTARGSLCCTVYLTQNLNSYYFAMGKQNPQARTKSLLGNLNTKIYHSNGDYDTNNFAAEAIGKDFRSMMSLNVQNTQAGSTTHSEQLHFEVFPHDFTMLKKGGRKKTGYKSEAIIFKSGDGWSNDKNYLKVTFSQNPKK